MKWLLLLFPLCSFSAPTRTIFVTNYIYVTNWVYGTVTNQVNTTNYVHITNTINNFSYVTTTNWITNVVVMPQVLSNLTVWGSIVVTGSSAGLIQTFSGTNVTGHLP